MTQQGEDALKRIRNNRTNLKINIHFTLYCEDNDRMMTKLHSECRMQKRLTESLYNYAIVLICRMLYNKTVMSERLCVTKGGCAVKEKTDKKFAFSLWVIGIVLLLTAAVFLLFYCVYGGNHAVSAMYPRVGLIGEYRIGDGEWQKIDEGKHIPVSDGDVYLRGEFVLLHPKNGEVLGRPGANTKLVFCLDHIGAVITEDDGRAHVFDAENPAIGSQTCGRFWSGYTYGGGEEVQIVLKNSHSFGNEDSADRFIDSIYVYAGAEFEKDIADRGRFDRIFGIFLVLFAVVIFAVSVFSALIDMNGSRHIALMGAAVLFGGIFFFFSSEGIMFDDFYPITVTLLTLFGCMFYMIFLMGLIGSFLRGKKQTAGRLITFGMGAVCFAAVLYSLFAGTSLYDLLGVWAACQSAACLAMAGLTAAECRFCRKKGKADWIFASAVMTVFVLDCAAMKLGLYAGPVLSKTVFCAMILMLLFYIIRIIPMNIRAEIRNYQLENEKNALRAELQEKRISVMIGQIRPHFIYNTLTSIEMLCRTDSREAARLVRNFSLYLRGNFSELDRTVPIPFAREIEHVRHYTEIELVRFPDMTVHFDLQSADFSVPALSIQPLVENAVKHGLMGLEEGGTVTVRSYENDTHYFAEVIDDGIGFDTVNCEPSEDHVGINNIRQRLELMCNGTLTIESEPGRGTRALIEIPKKK